LYGKSGIVPLPRSSFSNIAKGWSAKKSCNNCSIWSRPPARSRNIRFSSSQEVNKCAMGNSKKDLGSCQMNNALHRPCPRIVRGAGGSSSFTSLLGGAICPTEAATGVFSHPLPPPRANAELKGREISYYKLKDFWRKKANSFSHHLIAPKIQSLQSKSPYISISSIGL